MAAKKAWLLALEGAKEHEPDLKKIEFGSEPSEEKDFVCSQSFTKYLFPQQFSKSIWL